MDGLALLGIWVVAAFCTITCWVILQRGLDHIEKRNKEKSK